jgi:hypothetical protein
VNVLSNKPATSPGFKVPGMIIGVNSLSDRMSFEEIGKSSLNVIGRLVQVEDFPIPRQYFDNPTLQLARATLSLNCSKSACEDRYLRFHRILTTIVAMPRRFID